MNRNNMIVGNEGGTKISGRIVDVVNRRIFPGEITVADGSISSIQPLNEQPGLPYLLPGFVDAHVHIESSLLVPSEFARLAVVHGTVATVSDPHEIANVLGIEGVEFMLDNAARVPFHFCFGAPSCVPATVFETAGDRIDAAGIEQLLQREDIFYLSEMMNYHGVLQHDEDVMKKIAVARKFQKPVDGHAPGLMGEEAAAYIRAGTDQAVISTDHECFTYEEALNKLQHGMHILIREGSAAKNFEALIPLLHEFPDRIMFCSDDKHPDDLVKGHINDLVNRAWNAGHDFWNVLRAATLNPVKHYGLKCGLLREGDSADFIEAKDIRHLSAFKTYIRGNLVALNGKSLIQRVHAPAPNRFYNRERRVEEFTVPAPATAGKTELRVIVANDGQLITGEEWVQAPIDHGHVVPDAENDVLKFAVVNRYREAKPAICFIRNFGLKTGAIASCVGHDSHNILAVGVSDEALCRAVNLLVKQQGGLAAVSDSEEKVLPLPVAGIMSAADAYLVAFDYERLDRFAKALGSTLRAPFMTLSFMALLVIPRLKLSDLGLFDGLKFQFTEMFHAT